MSRKFVNALTVGAVAGALFAAPMLAGTASAQSWVQSPSPSPSDTLSASPSESPTGSSSPQMNEGAGVLYSESTVQGKEGKTVKVSTQWGKVGAVSGTSLTVESADGTSWTWQVDDDTRVGIGDQKMDAVKAGDQVAVAGTKEGEERSAVFVGDPAATVDSLVKEVKEYQ